MTPVFDATNTLTHLIALTRETTDETQQQLKVDAIHEAGDELADLSPEELAEMAVEERTDLLKYNIGRHMKDLLGLDFIEIRLLDRATNRLIPLLTEGMTPLAANRELYARKEGNGVTGFVAATGQVVRLPGHDPGPALYRGGRRFAQLADGPADHSRHGDRHAQRREPAARRVRRPRPPVHRDLRPQHRRGAQYARAAPGREGQHGQRIGRGDQPRAGPAAGRHHHRCDDRAGPLRGPR